MHDKLAALVNLGKHLGMFKEGAEFAGDFTFRWLEEGEPDRGRELIALRDDGTAQIALKNPLDRRERIAGATAIRADDLSRSPHVARIGTGSGYDSRTRIMW